jgi:hypothetical protein
MIYFTSVKLNDVYRVSRYALLLRNLYLRSKSQLGLNIGYSLRSHLGMKLQMVIIVRIIHQVRFFFSTRL